MGRRRGTVRRIKEKWKREKKRYVFKRSMVNRCPVCFHPLFWYKRVSRENLAVKWKVMCPKCGLRYETEAPIYYTEYEVYSQILNQL